MASYFEEHNCEPLKDGERPDHLLQLARLLIDGGYARDLEMEFESVFGKERPPPASKKVVAELPTLHTTPLQEAQGLKCLVCLAEYEEGEPMRKLPCDHCFHPTCILPWLEKTNSCPLCRHELPQMIQDMRNSKSKRAVLHKDNSNKTPYMTRCLVRKTMNATS